MAATQSERPFRIKTNLGEDALLLESFTGYERVSTPFHFEVEVLSGDPNVDMKAQLEKPVVISMSLDDEKERYIHGIISRFRAMEYGDDGLTVYRIEVVPWFWFLNLFSNCRIFQNKSVKDIIEQIFKDRGFPDYDIRTKGTYEPRDYCVQYRETDFNFVSRLMEDEGIFYFFEHTKDKHTLVLSDDKSDFKPCPHKEKAQYAPSVGGVLPEDTVVFIEEEYRVNTGTTTLTDYDFEKPQTTLYATLPSAVPAEYYDYPGKYLTKADGDRYTKLRLEEREVDIVTVRGKSTCMGFECGFKFKLEQHFREKTNQDYTLIALRHRGKNAPYRSASGGAFEYTNEFETIPNSVPFRPPRLARKPVIPSTQTAVVVGKGGEEIWTDKYGRVKVQFFWDREGKKDDNSSCWIRVAQGWAGKNWGIMFIPRIGHEVLVSFIEGDPDRPLISGSVYNADQMPPYALPGEQTKSTIKSYSSKGGGGFNEIRLEDKKDSEEIFIHGQKDLQIRIEKDRTEWIGQDRHLIVVRDKMEAVKRDSHSDITQDYVANVGRDHNVTIKGKAALSITGSNSISVTGDVIEEFKANHSCQVTQNLYIKGMQVVIEATMGLTLKVGSNFITLDPASGIAISGMPLVQINSGGSALSGSPGSLVSPLSPTAAKEAVKADPGDMVIPAGSAVSQLNMTLADLAAGAGKKSAASDAPTHNPNSPENADKKHYIEITMVDEDGKPVPGEAYKVTLPDGTTVANGTLDDKGYARVDNIDPGTCKVTFPNLDQDAWEPK